MASAHHLGPVIPIRLLVAVFAVLGSKGCCGGGTVVQRVRALHWAACGPQLGLPMMEQGPSLLPASPVAHPLAVTGRVTLGAGVGWWLRSHPRIPEFILVTAMILPQEPERVTWMWVMLSPTAQGYPGIPCVVLFSAWVRAGWERAEQPSKRSREEGWL